MRGYYTFGEKQERAALDAVLRARHAVIETVMMLPLVRFRPARFRPARFRPARFRPARFHPARFSSGPVSTGQQMALARELRSIPSAIVAAAAMRL
jgi:hypothetical protein